MYLLCDRRYKGSVIIFIAVLLLSNCHRVKVPGSEIDISDASSGDQLLAGFYPRENGVWCWTARRLSAALKPPEGAETRGATLEVQLFISDSQIESIGPITLSATTGGVELDPETFRQSGTHVYSRKIPATVMVTSLLPVEFTFDKASEPQAGDGR